jgi:hypothetical protein
MLGLWAGKGTLQDVLSDKSDEVDVDRPASGVDREGMSDSTDDLLREAGLDLLREAGLDSPTEDRAPPKYTFRLDDGQRKMLHKLSTAYEAPVASVLRSLITRAYREMESGGGNGAPLLPRPVTDVPDTESRWETLKSTNIFDLSPEDRTALAAYHAASMRHEIRAYMEDITDRVLLPNFAALERLVAPPMKESERCWAAMKIVLGWNLPSIKGARLLVQLYTQPHSAREGPPYSEKDRALIEEAIMLCEPGLTVAALAERLEVPSGDVQIRQSLLAKGRRADPLWEALDQPLPNRATYAQVEQILVSAPADTFDVGAFYQTRVEALRSKEPA